MQDGIGFYKRERNEESQKWKRLKDEDKCRGSILILGRRVSKRQQ